MYQLAAFLAACSSGSLTRNGRPILAALDLLAPTDPEEVSRLAAWLWLPGAGFTVTHALLGNTEIFRWLWCFGTVLETHTPGGGRAIGLHRGRQRVSILCFAGPPVAQGDSAAMAAAVQV